MNASIPRFLLPQGHLYTPYRPLRIIKAQRTARNPLPTCRHASASAVGTPKTIRLEKPAKFVPPSHGKRLKQQIPRHYGPRLTETQKTEQASKKYPNMMPPPGTFMFWFLTSRSIHTFITLVSPYHLLPMPSVMLWFDLFAESSPIGDSRPPGLLHRVRKLEA